MNKQKRTREREKERINNKKENREKERLNSLRRQEREWKERKKSDTTKRKMCR